MEQGTRPKKDFKKAVPLILLATLCFTTQATCGKLASATLGINFIILVRSLISMILVISWVSFRHQDDSFRTLFRTLFTKLYLIRTVFGLLAVYGYFYSIKYIPISNATLLFFTFPIFVPIIARVWLKIKIFHRLWWGIAISFVGILLFLRPEPDKLFHPFSIIALLSGICGATASITTRLMHYTETVKKILAHYALFSVLISGLIFFVFPEVFVENSGEMGFVAFLFLILTGIFGFLYQLVLANSAKYAPARYLSPFLFFSVILSFVPDFLIWDHEASIVTILGFILVSLGTVLMILIYPKQDLIYTRSVKDKNS